MSLHPPVLSVIDPGSQPSALADVRDLLATKGLSVDPDVELFVTARREGRLVGCLGLAGNVIKCSAVADAERGTGLSARLMEEMNYQALSRGRSHLFVYTKPTNRGIFESLGFTLLAEVPGTVILMENQPFALKRTCRALADQRVPGERIAGVVLNANPFTLGHQYLVETAAAECDAVHVWVVSEDASMFSAADRLALVRAGCAALPDADRIVVHPGTPYVVSKATFPAYFLNSTTDLVRGIAGLDLQLFRNHIARVLGITDRYVGTEPLSPVTRLYNNEMRYWLQEAPSAAPPINLRIVPRRCEGPEPVSASRVRALIADGRLDEVEPLVPPTTYAYLRERFAEATAVSPVS
ncbi:MAG: [citrate (pro-3S)-lyase] ligase [Propioniciclava sp.]|uniref:[citrate (pro-3S)-lyase] ligase n=1 Tax=Propioniciclava sp. TaxID=2038686 RepID=UPI0039E5274B